MQSRSLFVPLLLSQVIDWSLLLSWGKHTHFYMQTLNALPTNILELKLINLSVTQHLHVFTSAISRTDATRARRRVSVRNWIQVRTL